MIPLNIHLYNLLKIMKLIKKNSIILYNINESEDKTYMSLKQTDANGIKEFVSLINKDNIDNKDNVNIRCIGYFRLGTFEKKRQI